MPDTVPHELMLWSLDQLAQRTGKTVRYWRSEIKLGRLKPLRVGVHFRFSEPELQRYLEMFCVYDGPVAGRGPGRKVSK